MIPLYSFFSNYHILTVCRYLRYRYSMSCRQSGWSGSADGNGLRILPWLSCNRISLLWEDLQQISGPRSRLATVIYGRDDSRRGYQLTLAIDVIGADIASLSLTVISQQM